MAFSWTPASKSLRETAAMSPPTKVKTEPGMSVNTNSTAAPASLNAAAPLTSARPQFGTSANAVPLGPSTPTPSMSTRPQLGTPVPASPFASLSTPAPEMWAARQMLFGSPSVAKENSTPLAAPVRSASMAPGFGAGPASGLGAPERSASVALTPGDLNRPGLNNPYASSLLFAPFVGSIPPPNNKAPKRPASDEAPARSAPPAPEIETGMPPAGNTKPTADGISSQSASIMPETRENTPPAMLAEDAITVPTGTSFSRDHILKMGNKVLTVRVGRQPQHTDFTVHSNLLMNAPFFEGILNNFKNTDGFIMMVGHTPEAFSIYVTWLYSNRLNLWADTKKAQLQGIETVHRNEWVKLTDAYVLGEAVGDSAFCDVVMDALVEWILEEPAKEAATIMTKVPQLFSQQFDRSPIRQLLTDVVAWHFKDKDIQEMIAKHRRDPGPAKLPMTFLEDVLSKLSSRLQGQELTSFGPVGGRGTCKYHCHGAGKECYKKK